MAVTTVQHHMLQAIEEISNSNQEPPHQDDKDDITLAHILSCKKMKDHNLQCPRVVHARVRALIHGLL